MDNKVEILRVFKNLPLVQIMVFASLSPTKTCILATGTWRQGFSFHSRKEVLPGDKMGREGDVGYRSSYNFYK